MSLAFPSLFSTLTNLENFGLFWSSSLSGTDRLLIWVVLIAGFWVERFQVVRESGTLDVLRITSGSLEKVLALISI